MNRTVFIVSCILAIVVILGIGLYAYTDQVRRAERAKAIENTIVEIEKMEKRNVEIRNIDMPAFCAKLELDYLPDEDKCG